MTSDLIKAEDERLRRERAFHNDRFEEEENRDAQLKYYDAIKDCLKAYHERVIELAAGADILEYGCSLGRIGRGLAARAKSVVGIDISDVAIDHGMAKAKAAGQDNVHLEVMNAEKMTYEDNSFDLVFGSGIIHHLDVEKAFSEIARVLRPGGRAVFVEPLGHNPAIELYRRITPGARTPDEHPLLAKDFKRLDHYFDETDCKFHGLTTIAVVPFRNTPAKAPILAVTRALDKGLFALPAVKWWAWFSLMEARMASSVPVSD